MPITKEQEDALRLIESGMSQRKAAKVLRAIDPIERDKFE